MPEVRALAPGYIAETDAIDEQGWCQALQTFDDANIYQTWSYAHVTSGRHNMSHLVLRKDGELVAMVQARIARLPTINAGIAYVRWGPLWRRTGLADPGDTFRQIIRALRNEFACQRGLSLRLFPLLFDDDAPRFCAILAEEGFSSLVKETPSRTLRIDLRHPLENLRAGMGRNWKRNLREAEGHDLEILEGSDDKLFAGFIDIYREMVFRKRFSQPNDIHQYRLMQAVLPDKLRMKVMLCRSGASICAGIIWSEMGDTGIELFAATTTTGTTNKGSYLLRWKLVETLKGNGRAFYDLNGINPSGNPGGYKFKRELGGKNAADLCFLGQFDLHGSLLSRLCVQCGDLLRSWNRSGNWGKLLTGSGTRGRNSAGDNQDGVRIAYSE